MTDFNAGDNRRAQLQRTAELSQQLNPQPSIGSLLLDTLSSRFGLTGTQAAALGGATPISASAFSPGAGLPESLTTPAGDIAKRSAIGGIAAPSASQATSRPATGTVQTTPLDQLQATAAAQRKYAEGVQNGTIPGLASQGGAAFPRLSDFSATGEPVSGGALTPQVLLGQQYGIDPSIITTKQYGPDTVYGFKGTNGVPTFTNVVPGTAGAQPLLGQGGVVFAGGSGGAAGTSGVNTSNGDGGINFGATGAGQFLNQFLNPQQAAAPATAGPVVASLGGGQEGIAGMLPKLVNQITDMANTPVMGGFVDTFQALAARKRGQQALAQLASVAGQAESNAAMQRERLAAEQGMNNARLQQAAQEAQQRNALLAGQSLLQAQTSLAERQAGNQAALAKLNLEAPKAQAETAKAQIEAQNLQLAQNAKLAYLKNPTPENAAILQAVITGQAQVPQKPTVVKTLTANGESVGLLSPSGQIMAQGTLPELQEQQQAKAALTAAPGQPYRSALNPDIIYFIDPATKMMRSGSAKDYAAAVGGQ